MASLKEIRIRIASVSSTRQITSAMKMVSAAKLRKSQDAITQLRPYSQKMTDIVANLSRSISGVDENVYARDRDRKKILVVMITSNKGLCGAFNANVSKRVMNLLADEFRYLYSTNKVDIVAIGKKGHDFLRSKGIEIKENSSHLFDQLSFEKTVVFAEDLLAKFASGQYDEVVMVYNQFRNAANQVVIRETLLPVSLETESGSSNVVADYIFEPGQEQIVHDLIPKMLKLQFYRALLDSFAAEHGARMTAMHKATDNATELLRDLRINYNKARQSAITNEILEIVSGANAIAK